jgi:hypothetical protein
MTDPGIRVALAALAIAWLATTPAGAAQNTAPSILTQPRSQAVVAGGTATFWAAAAGTAPLSYQWQFNGTTIASATATNLVLSSLQASDGGGYTVAVTNLYGAVTSAVAVLTVLVPPAIVTQPQSATNVFGTTATFSATATGNPPPAYQWQFNGLNLTDGGRVSGAATNVLNIAGVQPADGGGYVLVASNVAGVATSTVAVLSLAGPPMITNQPASQSVVLGANAALTVAAAGTQPFSFQWLFNGSPLPGATSATLGVTNVQLSDGGGYLVVVTNVYGSATSSVAVLTVLVPPTITAQPQSLTVVTGATAGFSAAATGGALSYQWQRNGLNLTNGGRFSGVATNALNIAPVQATDAGSYTMLVSNAAGVATSAAAVLTVAGPPVILSQSASQGAATGNYVTLSVSATGTPPLNYQWWRNGIALLDGGHVSGTTGAALTLVNAQTNDSGSYTVVVTNSSGSATSALVQLRVVVPVDASTWETADIGAVWSDTFDRASLGTNWVILGSVNATIVSSGLCFTQTNVDQTRQVYYQPWQTCSSAWTLRWTQRFGTLDAGSLGVGFGIKNFQAQGGDDRGYNGLLSGAGTNRGCMQIQRWNGTAQVLAASGPALALAAGDYVDCSLTRSNWTITATASNRANAQVSSTSIVFSDAAGLIAPTISRACFYPLGGTIYIHGVSFTLNHRKPARFIQIGASCSDGYNATSYDHAFVSVLQSNLNETVCNDSGSFNTTSNSTSIVAEILAHQPDTASLLIGDNDMRFGYPASQWQGYYSNLVAQLLANGVKVKHCLPTPQNLDLTPLRNWILATYPASDIIDTWTPLLNPGGGTTLNPAYDSGDGFHPNNAGHLMIGQIILSNLPPAIRVHPQSLIVRAGSNVMMTATAMGAAPLGYQWRKNGLSLQDGGNVAGAASSALTLAHVQAGDAGNYQVVVANNSGAVLSLAASLTVLVPPPPAIQSLGLTNGVVTITWSSAPGFFYLLQRKDDMNDPVWADLPPPVTAGGTNAATTDLPGAVLQRFYRVLVEPW